MTLVDLYRNVYHLCKSLKASSSDMALLFVIIGEWNEQRRPECLQTSRRELQELSSLPETTVRRALQRFCSWRLIETEHAYGKLVIKIRPQADWRIACGNETKERRIQDEKPAPPLSRCAQKPLRAREECARAREDDGMGLVTVAQILAERRAIRGKE